MTQPDPPSMRPYGRQVFICIHGDCAGPELGERLHRRFTELNRLHGLNKLRNPERVKCSLADCLGVCSGGPVVVVYPDGIWYHHVDEAALERIYQEHILGGQPVEALIFHRLYPAGQQPAYAPIIRGEAEDEEGKRQRGEEAKKRGGEDAQRQGGDEVRTRRDEEAKERRDDEVERRGRDEVRTRRSAEAKDGPDGLNSASPDSSPPHLPASSPPHLTNLSPPSAEAVRAAIRRQRKKKGLVIVNTGLGKGKTTAALGVMTRAWGRNMKIGVLQFLKNEKARFGEIKAGERMGGIDWISTGDGWTWTSKAMDETEARARHGWQIAQERIAGGQYDLLILDEFTYPLHYGWLDTGEVIEWLKANKPPMLHLIITGRYAPEALVEYADLVTEMRQIKHPFKEQGIRAQAGIEY